MEKEEIIKKWKQGLSKEVLAKIYKSKYNQRIKIIRSNLENRHKGKFITNYEALEYIEKIIYMYVKGEK